MNPLRQSLSACAAVAILSACGAQSQAPGLTLAASTAQAAHRASGSYGYCPAWPSGTGLLPDGDFSQAADEGQGAIAKGVSFAPDWKSSGPATIDFQASTFPYWQAPNDVCTVDLDGTPGPGGIRHGEFPTKKRATYTATFEMSANGSCAPTVKELLVQADGQFTTFRWDTTGGNDAQDGDWSQEAFQFSATSKKSMIMLKSEDPKGGNCGPIVAAISITKD